MKIAVWRSPTEEVEMKFAQTMQLNATDTALLSAVPPLEPLPRPSQVSLSFKRASRPLIGAPASRPNTACASWRIRSASVAGRRPAAQPGAIGFGRPVRRLRNHIGDEPLVIRRIRVRHHRGIADKLMLQ